MTVTLAFCCRKQQFQLLLLVTLPGALLAPVSSSLTTRRSSLSSSLMQTSYRLPHPLPPLPVRKGVRGRRPKSQTLALLKAAAEAAAAEAASSSPSRTSPAELILAPRPHKKRGPKPGSKRKPRLVQSSGSSPVSPAPSETRLSTDSNHSNGSNVVCTVCVYVNKHGDYGPNLDRKLVQQLPDHFGPAPVNSVLQQAVQACVDCTFQPSALLNFLQSQSHSGGEVIRVRSDHGIRYVKLPSVSSASSVLRFLENLCSHLQSDSMFSSQPFSPFTNTNTVRYYERSKSENGLSSDSSKETRPQHNASADYRVAKKERVFYPQLPAPPAPPLRRVTSHPSDIAPVHRRVEAPSSTTDADHMKQDAEIPGNDASCWTVDEVVRFVQEADPLTLGPHVDLFRKHEIDGKALLLLRSDVIMKYMGLKLGPALKLCHHIEKLKHSRP
uniref:SAM domain-containing protein n=1 Tax=Knipowitschia caucasica TaxID=637954 RepID=A0AAV2LML2_KNICA